MDSGTEGIREKRERVVNQLQLNRKGLLENENRKQGGGKGGDRAVGKGWRRYLISRRQEIKERVNREARETMSSFIWGERERKPTVVGQVPVISGACP